MNVLVDTCVWSLSLRRRKKSLLTPDEQKLVTLLAEATRDGRVVMIGPIRQEVLSGIRDEAQFAKIAELLDPFPDQELQTADYVGAARIFNVCRNHGLQGGPVDMLLCSVVLRRKWQLMTADQGLLRCLALLKGDKRVSLSGP